MTGPSIEWRVHPARDRPMMGGIVLAIILVLSVLAGVWTRVWFWGVFSFLVLFLSLEPFYFPTRFRLEEKGLTVVRRFSKSEREWKIFRRCELDLDGITLSPYRKRGFMDPYRSIRIRFGGMNRDEVARFVRERVDPGIEWIQDSRWTNNVTAA